MKFSSKEQRTLLVISAVVGAYDFFSLPFTSFIITALFAGMLYFLTSSLYIVALCALVPQFIRIVNYFMNKKENFVANDPNQITEALIKQLKKHNNKELFRNPTEISNRVQQMKNDKKESSVQNLAGLVDISVPSSEISIQANPSIPSFMEEFQNATPLDINTHIDTVAESSVPLPSNERPVPRNNIFVEQFDAPAVGDALIPTTNSRPQNLKGLEMNTGA